MHFSELDFVRSNRIIKSAKSWKQSSVNVRLMSALDSENTLEFFNLMSASSRKLALVLTEDILFV